MSQRGKFSSTLIALTELGKQFRMKSANVIASGHSPACASVFPELQLLTDIGGNTHEVRGAIPSQLSHSQ